MSEVASLRLDGVDRLHRCRRSPGPGQRSGQSRPSAPMTVSSWSGRSPGPREGRRRRGHLGGRGQAPSMAGTSASRLASNCCTGGDSISPASTSVASMSGRSWTTARTCVPWQEPSPNAHSAAAIRARDPGLQAVVRRGSMRSTPGRPGCSPRVQARRHRPEEEADLARPSPRSGPVAHLGAGASQRGSDPAVGSPIGDEVSHGAGSYRAPRPDRIRRPCRSVGRSRQPFARDLVRDGACVDAPQADRLLVALETGPGSGTPRARSAPKNSSWSPSSSSCRADARAAACCRRRSGRRQPATEVLLGSASSISASLPARSATLVSRAAHSSRGSVARAVAAAAREEVPSPAAAAARRGRRGTR